MCINIPINDDWNDNTDWDVFRENYFECLLWSYISIWWNTGVKRVFVPAFWPPYIYIISLSVLHSSSCLLLLGIQIRLRRLPPYKRFPPYIHQPYFCDPHLLCLTITIASKTIKMKGIVMNEFGTRSREEEVQSVKKKPERFQTFIMAFQFNTALSEV